MLKIATLILPLAILSTAAMAQQDSTGAAGNPTGTTRANGGTEATPQTPNGNPQVKKRQGRLQNGRNSSRSSGATQGGTTGSTTGQSSPSTTPQ